MKHENTTVKKLRKNNKFKSSSNEQKIFNETNEQYYDSKEDYSSYYSVSDYTDEIDDIDIYEIEGLEREKVEKEEIKTSLQELKKKEKYNMATAANKNKPKEEMDEEMGNYIEPPVKNREEMQPYIDLFNSALFHEAFLLLEKNVKNLDIIEKNVHIREFFGFIFDDVYFNDLLENNRLLPVASSLVSNLKNKEFLNEMGARFGDFVDTDIISIMYSFLLQNNEFDKAEFLTKFFSPNLANFPNTISEIVSNKNIKALHFICENMDNIHYNEGALLRIASDMPSNALKMLIDEFSFDINEQSKETGDSLVSALVREKNIKNFKFIFENYGARVNIGVTSGKKDRTNTLFELMDKSGMATDFFEVLLDDPTLKASYVERIAQTLFSDTTTISACLHTNIYDKLFAHPKFESHTINFGQKYFIYGILAKMGNAATKQSESAANVYLKVLESYLNNNDSRDVPDSNDYHVLGAAVMIASISGSKSAMDAAGLIMAKYPQHLNRANPNNVLPINQVEKDSPLYRLLVNEGAHPLEEAQGFWDKITGKKPKRVEYQEQIPEATIKNSSGIIVAATPIAKTRVDVENAFKQLKPLLNDNLCDPRIKLRCENMFLTTNKLLNIMEENNIQDAFQGLNFLEDNMSKHLFKTLEYYIHVCKTSSKSFSEELREEKLEAIFKKSNDLVGLIENQIIIFSETVLGDLEQDALKNLRVHERFLNEKFHTSSAKDVKEKTVRIDAEKSGIQFKDMSKIIEINTSENSSQQLNLDLSSLQNDEKEIEIGETPSTGRKMKM